MIVHKPRWQILWYSKAPLRVNDERSIGQVKKTQSCQVFINEEPLATFLKRWRNCSYAMDWKMHILFSSKNYADYLFLVCLHFLFWCYNINSNHSGLCNYILCIFRLRIGAISIKSFKYFLLISHPKWTKLQLVWGLNMKNPCKSCQKIPFPFPTTVTTTPEVDKFLTVCLLRYSSKKVLWLRYNKRIFGYF